MDQPQLPFPKRRLYVSEWPSRTLHGVALMMNRLRAEQDLSERQEWLYDKIIEELEARWVEDVRLRPRDACMCELCFSPWAPDDLGHDSSDRDPDPPCTRPEGRGISRHRPQGAA